MFLFFSMSAEDSSTEIAISGDMAEDFGRLYEQYLPGVFRYVSYRLGDRAAAEDVTADIFNKALNNFHKYDSAKAEFSTWIFTIARNTLIDYYRKRSREQKLSEDAEETVPATSLSPDEAASRTEDIRKLHECLADLNPNERELISLKFGGEMTNRAIAQITGLSESNVGTILCRAIRKLRDGFAGWQDER